MKIIPLFAGALFMALTIGCKNKETNANMTGGNDTLQTDQTTTTAADARSTTGAPVRTETANRRLTQAEIDSIKAERNKVVTPPSRSGASLTPGSGTAVPGNNETSGGTNADMGSSTGK